jgi:hypothetical protein
VARVDPIALARNEYCDAAASMQKDSKQRREESSGFSLTKPAQRALLSRSGCVTILRSDPSTRPSSSIERSK